MPLRNYLLGVLLSKVAFRSLFFALLSLVVIIILAYLTNPSETSFRTYLTEQSFRQHLSRLDDTNDDEHNGHVHQQPRHPQSSRGSNSNDGISPFHFANRASISLRTPKHIFHSFGIFTIAAMVPVAKPNNTSSPRNIYRDGSMITDSWFIGAFGKWWHGGIIEAWYHDIVARSKDEESWNSGILSMKVLDKYNEYHNGLPFTTKNPLPSAQAHISPPRLKTRERPSQRLSSLPARSSTPPPLPKSASLPLHATRLPSSAPDHRHAQVDRTAPKTTPSLPTASERVRLETPAPSRSPSALFDQSPLIAEVLRQISASNSTVHDLREQLADFQSTASQSHTLLQSEVDSYRDRKRQEDASRLELKSRTKTLEDSKRSAESTKLKAERKLKAAQNAHNDASRRIEFLDQQITELQRVLVDGEVSALKSKDDASQAEQNILADLESKKQDIKDAEDLITALNARARELEEQLAGEREKLQLAREQAEIRRQDRSFFPSYAEPDRNTMQSIPANHLDTLHREHVDATIGVDQHLDNAVSSNREHSVSPRVAKLSLGAISNFNNVSSDKAQLALRAKGYSIFDDDIASLNHSQPGTVFSPFGDINNGLDQASIAGTLPMPLSSSIAPTGVIGSPHGTDHFNRAFHLDNDPLADKDRRGVLFLSQPGNTSPLTTSPVSIQDEYDPFEVRMPPLSSPLPLPTTPLPIAQTQARPRSLMDLQRFTILQRTHTDPPHASEFKSPSPSVEAVDENKVVIAAPRRWFSARERPRKGLNPDAKVFNLSRKAMSIPINNMSLTGNSHATAISAPVPYDALNPNGVSSSSNISTASSAFLHAFAPSKEEREALQRVLGGGSNTSLDRLPSLSDMGSISSSIPSSPSRLPTQLPSPPPPVTSTAGVTTGGPGQNLASGRLLPSWLQALPRIRKPNFSPWDDDEVVVDPVASGIANRKH